MVEVMFSGAPLFEALDRAILQNSSYLELSGISRGAVVLFYPGELPGPYERVKTPENGKLSVVVIKVDNQSLRRSAKSLVVEVDPTRLELVTSAMRSQYDSLPELSGVCKIPANKHICCVVRFSRFQDIYSGCCTVAAQVGLLILARIRE
jgi:hypothetical protein